MTNSFYHYCPLDTFLAIIESREIRLTNIFCMNDSAEHYWLRRIAKDILDRNCGGPKTVSEFLASTLFSKEDDTDLYCFCMSELGDSLGQWRAYADDGRGVAIGFSKEYLRAAEKEYRQSGLRLEPVVYDRGVQERRVKDIIENAEGHDRIRPSLESGKLPENFSGLCAKSGIWFEAARCKNPCFAEKQEVRLIYDGSLGGASGLGQRRYRAHGDTLIPYYALPLLPVSGNDIPIYEVVLGPKSNREFNEPIVEELLSVNGYNVTPLTVWHSEASYR